MGTRGSFQGCEADHSHPSSTEVKNAWICNSTPQYAFKAWCSVKAQGLFYLTFKTQYKYQLLIVTKHLPVTLILTPLPHNGNCLPCCWGKF
jgi:hypothetical protein